MPRKHPPQTADLYIVEPNRYGHADIIDRLQALLALAEAGQLRAIAYATVHQDHDIGTGWMDLDSADDEVRMIGAVNLLAQRYTRAVLDRMD